MKRCNFQNSYDVVARFWGQQTHIFKATMMKFGMRVRTWDTLSKAKFCKNHIRGYTPLLGKFIPKNISILAILGAVGPHFLSHSGEIWHEGADL